MELNYSDYAIVLNWEIINDEPDIGNWKMLFEEDNSEINGKGMSDLLETLLLLKNTQINVVYVKNLNLFEVIGENYFAYSSDFMGVVKEGHINFFNLKIFEWVQLVNWDSFFKEVDSCEEFLRRLNLCRNNFKGQNKNKLSLKSHYRITKATDQWFDITEKYYLKGKWANSFREELVPQDPDELDLYLKVYKGSYYFTNFKYINQTIENVYGYDISSSHSGFIFRKKYPLGSAQTVETDEEVFEIINKEFYAWIGEFEIVDLRYKERLPMDMRKFGFINKNDNWQIVLTNAHWKTFKRVFQAKSFRPLSFRYFQNKELDRNYAEMIHTLYEEKEQYKKRDDEFVSSIFKFRTELPFGQSIKAPKVFSYVSYNEETNTFEKWRADEEPFEDVIVRIKRYALPMQIGIWTAAYSWSEEVNMILDIGIENVVYGDTDCVKFLGKEGIKVIEAHNKEIDEEFRIINGKRRMVHVNKKLGRWQNEGLFTRFKAIGVKWYLFEGTKGLEVKAAGADCKVLLNWLQDQDNPFEEFNKDMNVPKLFKNISINQEKKTVHIGYNNYMGDKVKKEISEATNGFFI